MAVVFSLYGLSILALIILAIGSWFIWDRRYKKHPEQPIPEGYIRTKEIFIDPTTKKRMVVYFHPETGVRFYKEEP
ncbi:hypothetical protein [Bacillus sp. SD088]|uniref:hypothetical protein n=1 Tax=Bacillus sp. SD088 TaxID=2782012 RepID=UPI001A962542|nr:hypothetical protein [Bacillus sp. SD088]MBO0993829.1 hypothetical protein [Bacillus sp. SD088]